MDEWIDAGIMERLQALVLDAYDRMIELDLYSISVDECIAKSSCGGDLADRSPVDPGKQGLRRSTVVDTKGIPLGAITATIPGRLVNDWRAGAACGDCRAGQARAGHGGASGRSWSVPTPGRTLVWCTERRAGVIGFWLAFSAVITIVRQLVLEGWLRYRCGTRPQRRP